MVLSVKISLHVMEILTCKGQLFTMNSEGSKKKWARNDKTISSHVVPNKLTTAILRLWLCKIKSLICFQPKIMSECATDTVLVDQLVTGRADKGHTKPLIFTAHNPFHRALTWISSASLTLRLGSRFK